MHVFAKCEEKVLVGLGLKFYMSTVGFSLINEDDIDYRLVYKSVYTRIIHLTWQYRKM